MAPMCSIDRQQHFPATDGDTVSVLSWNLLAPCFERFGLDWTTVRFPALIEWLHRFAAADVVCFQEVEVASGALKDVESMMAALGFESVVQNGGEFPVVNV